MEKEDIEIEVVSKKAVMIGNQLVIEVSEKTYNDVKENRKIDDEEHFRGVHNELGETHNEKQLYIDNASVCLILKS